LRCGCCAVAGRPTPEWLQKRLISIGLRPITPGRYHQLTTYDRCPGRCIWFDAKKFRASHAWRRARDGENLAALDVRTYTLRQQRLRIADDTASESLAGLMGG